MRSVLLLWLPQVMVLEATASLQLKLEDFCVTLIYCPDLLLILTESVKGSIH